jgi:hypothetical protein
MLHGLALGLAIALVIAGCTTTQPIIVFLPPPSSHANAELPTDANEPIAPPANPNVATTTEKTAKNRLQGLGYQIVSESESIVSSGSHGVVARRGSVVYWVFVAPKDEPREQSILDAVLS